MPTNCLCLTRRLCKSDCHYLAAKINFCRDFPSFDKCLCFYFVVHVVMPQSPSGFQIMKILHCHDVALSERNGDCSDEASFNDLTCRRIAVASRTGGMSQKLHLQSRC